MRKYWFAWLAGLALALAAPSVWADSDQSAHAADKPHAADAHGEDKPALLQFDPGAAIWSIIVFVVLLLVLRATAWKPILRVLNDREAFIDGCLKDARAERESAEKLLAEYQAQLDRAREEAAALIDKGRQDADTVRQKMLEDARRETSELTDRAKRDIQRATAAALQELYERTAELSVTVAGRIIDKELSTTDHARLIADSVAEIRKSGPAQRN